MRINFVIHCLIKLFIQTGLPYTPSSRKTLAQGFTCSRGSPSRSILLEILSIYSLFLLGSTITVYILSFRWQGDLTGSPSFSFSQGITPEWNVNKSQASCFKSFSLKKKTKKTLKRLSVFEFQRHFVLAAWPPLFNHLVLQFSYYT